MNNVVSVPGDLTFYRDPGTLIYVTNSDGSHTPAMYTPIPADSDSEGAVTNGIGDYIVWTDVTEIVVPPAE